MKKNIYLHEKKYLSSREKIFLFMKKNIYYRDNKTLTTVVYHFLPLPLPILYHLIIP